eukprot:TRINITY_DN11904_c0_g1_i1.p1 TRINITY_DN11904_c0_g1~~TRINITY_DN11904_c0_g1_i1.p1  ORF type:complete len:1013 (+),score=107.85 TRINITY_DN11904_c0_g1_i1:25-3063(+)
MPRQSEQRQLRCFSCSRLIEDPIIEDGGKVYHTKCIAEKKGEICGGCSQPLMEECFVALGKRWHGHCFKCKKCGLKLSEEVSNPRDRDGVYKAAWKQSWLSSYKGDRPRMMKEIPFSVSGSDPYHPGCLPITNRRFSVPIPAIQVPSPTSNAGSPTVSPIPTPHSPHVSRGDSTNVRPVQKRQKSPLPQYPNPVENVSTATMPSVVELDGAIWSISPGSNLAICQQDATQRAKVKMAGWPEIKKEANLLKLAAGAGVLEVIGKILTRNNKALLLTAWKAGGDVFSKTADTAGQGLDEPFAKNIFSKLMKALLRCRKHGLAHRDVTLENIILGTVKGPSYLHGFKLSRRYQDEEKATDVVGGPIHVSPEALKFLNGDTDGYDPFTADMWAAGVCLHQMLSGRDPRWVRKMPVGLTPGLGGFGTVPPDKPLQKYIKAVEAGSGGVPRTVSNDAKNLLSWILTTDPMKRPTPTEALSHPWLASLSIKPTEGRRLVKLSDNTSLLLVVLSAAVSIQVNNRIMSLSSAFTASALLIASVRTIVGNPLRNSTDSSYKQTYTTAAMAVLVIEANKLYIADDETTSSATTSLEWSPSNIDHHNDDDDETVPNTGRLLETPLSSRVNRESRSRSLLGIRRESLPINIQKRMRGWTKAETKRLPEGFHTEIAEELLAPRKTPRVRRPVESVDDVNPLQPGTFRKRMGSTVRIKRNRRAPSHSLIRPGQAGSPKTPRTASAQDFGEAFITEDEELVPLQRSKTDGILLGEPPPIRTPTTPKPQGGSPVRTFPNGVETVTPVNTNNNSTSTAASTVGSPKSVMASSPKRSAPVKLRTKARKGSREIVKKDEELPPPPDTDGSADKTPEEKPIKKGLRRMQSGHGPHGMPLLRLGQLPKSDSGGGLLTARTGMSTARSDRTRASSAATNKSKKRGSGSPPKRSKSGNMTPSPFGYHSAHLRSEMNRSLDRPPPALDGLLRDVARAQPHRSSASSAAPAPNHSPPSSPKRKGTAALYEAVFGGSSF